MRSTAGVHKIHRTVSAPIQRPYLDSFDTCVASDAGASASGELANRRLFESPRPRWGLGRLRSEPANRGEFVVRVAWPRILALQFRGRIQRGDL